MNPQNIQLIAKFFFFALLDEELAVRLTNKAVHRLARRRRLEHASEEKFLAQVVRVTDDIIRSEKKTKAPLRPNLSYKLGFKKPEDFDLSAWMDFHKGSQAPEMWAVIWVHILGLKPEVVAEGLGETLGTVRYRTSQGVRQLGQALRVS